MRGGRVTTAARGHWWVGALVVACGAAATLAIAGLPGLARAFSPTRVVVHDQPPAPTGASGNSGASNGAPTGPTGAAPTGPTGANATFPAPTWTDTVGPIALTSPTVATIDGEQAVVFAAENGYLYVVDALTGQNLPGWPQPVQLGAGQPTAVESSPTVAYLDGPAAPPTIIVGAGSTYVARQTGGLIAFRADGTVRFRFSTYDIFNEWHKSAPGADGYDEGVFSTPAIGDVTGSGTPDIVFGSYDHHLYALRPDGTLVPGFPIDTEDTIWSSPALFHVRGKPGLEDIFIGGDASGKDKCWGGFVYDYTYARHAPHLVWSHCKNQTIWSSPAVGILNSTGRPAVVVGTGFGEVPPYKSDSYKFFAFYAKNGARVPGWPKRTAGPSFGSPAIGPLGPGGQPMVFESSWCMTCGPADPGKSVVYAWYGNGHLAWSQSLVGANVFASPVLADLTGSGTNDVVIGSSAGLYVLDGSTGAYLFGQPPNDTINTCSAQNAVTITDVTGAGPGAGWHLFEACGGPHEIIGTGRLIDYPLPATPVSTPPWSTWRGDANHDGVATATLLATAS